MLPLAQRKNEAFQRVAESFSVADLRYETQNEPGFKTLDPKRIQLLRQRFLKEGCHPTSYPVTIWRDTDKKPTDYTCLDGKHRIEAAKLLPNTIVRWSVSIYHCSGKDRELLTFLRDGDSGLIPYSDGDIYCNYIIKSLTENERRSWLAKLSPSKQKDVKRLEDMADKHTPTKLFKHALDKLARFPGLWADFKIGCFHRLLTMHCPEELEYYLNEMDNCWSKITNGQSTSVVSLSTVRALEGKYPEYSDADRDSIWDSNKSNLLFESLPLDKRYELVQNCVRSRGRILSLRYFLEDSKFLEPASKLLRATFETTGMKSIYQQMSRCFTPTRSESGNIQYLKAWLKAIQLFPMVATDFTLRKDPRRPKPLRRRRSEAHAAELSRELVKLGFITPLSQSLSSIDWLAPHVHTLLEETCPKVNSQAKTQASTQVIEIVKKLLEQSSSVPRLSLPPFQSSYLVRDEERCGMPFEAAFIADSPNFLYPHIYGADVEKGPALYPSSFALRRDQIRSFLCAGKSIRSEQPHEWSNQTKSSEDALFDDDDTDDMEPLPQAETDTEMDNGSQPLQNSTRYWDSNDARRAIAGRVFQVPKTMNREELSKLGEREPEIEASWYRKGFIAVDKPQDLVIVLAQFVAVLKSPRTRHILVMFPDDNRFSLEIPDTVEHVCSKSVNEGYRLSVVCVTGDGLHWHSKNAVEGFQGYTAIVVSKSEGMQPFAIPSQVSGLYHVLSVDGEEL